MADATTAEIPVATAVSAPAPEETQISDDWKASVAGKKLSAGIVMFVTALFGSPAFTAVLNAFDNLVAPLANHGITININPIIVATPAKAKIVGAAVFGVLVLVHDWLKFKKTEWKWL